MFAWKGVIFKIEDSLSSLLLNVRLAKSTDDDCWKSSELVTIQKMDSFCRQVVSQKNSFYIEYFWCRKICFWLSLIGFNAHWNRVYYH